MFLSLLLMIFSLQGLSSANMAGKIGRLVWIYDSVLQNVQISGLNTVVDINKAVVSNINNTGFNMIIKTGSPVCLQKDFCGGKLNIQQG